MLEINHDIYNESDQTNNNSEITSKVKPVSEQNELCQFNKPTDITALSLVSIFL